MADIEDLKWVHLEFRGEPVAKAAMQNVMVRGMVHKFLPKKTKDFFADIRAQACQQLEKGFVPMRGALRISVVFRRQKPKKPKKGGELFPISRPDLSNYIKGIEDALNTIVWEDDAQIFEILARKEYGTPGIGLDVYEVSSCKKELELYMCPSHPDRNR